MLRIFAIAALAGAVLTLALLHFAKPVAVPWVEPVITRDSDEVVTERWTAMAADRVAATGQGVQPFPTSIVPLTDPRLASLGVETLKIRDAQGEVIGVASRIAAAERDGGPRAVWWTFVMGLRGTLAAHATDEGAAGDGRLVGGTRSFAGVAGRLVERRRDDGGYDLAVLRDGSAGP